MTLMVLLVLHEVMDAVTVEAEVEAMAELLVALAVPEAHQAAEAAEEEMGTTMVKVAQAHAAKLESFHGR